MDYCKLIGRIWKTKIAVSNGNTDWGEITINQIARFARKERKRSCMKRTSLAPTTKWVVDVALKNYEEYAKLFDDKEDIKLVAIAIQRVQGT